MEKLKNLFDYATSELSQDAFLCWLFENYNCENSVVRNAALELLGKMTKLDCSTPGAVTELKTKRQETENYPNPEPQKDEKKSIHCVFDIIVTFRYREEKHMLLIEDKIFSSPSNKQIDFYPQAFKEYARKNSIPESKQHLVIYKSDIDLYGYKEKSSGWNKSFYLDEINSFFEKQQHSGCLIFDQYKEHIAELHKATQQICLKPMSDWEKEKFPLVRFRTYIIKELFPLVEERSDIFDPPSIWGWHSYRSLGFSRKKQDKIDFSMEIKFNPDWDRAVVTIRVGGYDYDGEWINPKDDKFEELKKKIRGLIGDSSCFHGYKGEYCIGKEKERGKKQQRLLYCNGAQKITEEVRELIDDFAKLCKAVNDLFKKESELIKTISIEKKKK